MYAAPSGTFHHSSSRLNRKRRKLRLSLEQLESRYLLDGSGFDYQSVDSDWFESVDAKVSLHQTVGVNASELRFVGPLRPSLAATTVSQQWIVRLTEAASESLTSLSQADRFLDSEGVNFDILRGLGLPGMMLVESHARSEWTAADYLSDNTFVELFSRNESVSASVVPNDPEFPNMVGLDNVGQFGVTPGADVNAPEAWEFTTGKASIVVGVIDSGVDPTHPDLYLNIWVNQGEIPVSIREQLQDIDGDNLFTFYDLNDPSNASQARDVNGNSYIDAMDLLTDPLWADGIDSDGNGFIDDFFGWNFRSGANEPFAPNNPSDVLGHGTHVSGTIAAIGNNALGVTGLNWQSSIMALKFLDQNNAGDTADAIAAINYATMMRTQFNVNIPVTNNSWGTPGGFNAALQAAIQLSRDADMLFVAASGNGNILGRGVDNDVIPFYPASYDLDNIIAVGASNSRDSIARFSNFGRNSVDVLAPGVGIISTLPGGRYEVANGTSMAAPHVAGTVALIHSRLPGVTAAEVKSAIINSAKLHPIANNQVASGGRIDTAAALNDSGFAPRTRFLPSQLVAPFFELDRFSEIESNDTVFAPQDVDSGPWNLSAQANIAESTTLAHLSTLATGNDTADYFSFTVANDGDRGIFDIDARFGTSFDPTIDIYDASGNILESGFDHFEIDPGSTDTSDPFVEVAFPTAGTYIIGVTSGFDFSGIPFGAAYTLHASVENHPTDPAIVVQDVSLFLGGLNSDTDGTLQTIDEGPWHTGASPRITESVLIPHVSITGTGDGTADLFRFNVANAGDRGIFDIDIDLFNVGFGFDATIDLYQEDGTLLATSFDDGIDAGSFQNAGGFFTDPLLDFTFRAPGTYVVAVTSGPSFEGIPAGVTYDLHVSLENHPLDTSLEANVITFETAEPFALTVQYSDLIGIDLDSIATDNIAVRQNTTGEVFVPTLPDGFAALNSDPKTVTATYYMEPPGGSWDPLDFGTYTVILNPNTVSNTSGVTAVPVELATFSVRISNESNFIVTTIEDTNDADLTKPEPRDGNGEISLRSAIEQSNQTSAPRFIFLDAKHYTLTLGDVLSESEPNDEFTSAQDLETGPWSLIEDDTVVDSTTIPHVSVSGTGNGNTRDFYRFQVANAGDRGIFDIDFGSFIGNFDAGLRLLDANGTLLASAIGDGANPSDAGSVTGTLDPMLDFTFMSAGTYILEVQHRDGGPPGFGESYRLNVSIENHPVAQGQATDDFHSGDLDILRNITIVGMGKDTVIDANGLDRVFDVHPGATLSVLNATITGGFADRGAGIQSRAAGLAPITSENVREIFEDEPNESFFPQNINASAFSIESRANITDSATIPHATIFADGDDSEDFFQITVPNAGARGIIDIDNVFSGGDIFDGTLEVFNSSGFFVLSFDQSTIDPGSADLSDPYLDIVFPEAGVYTIGVTSGSGFAPVPLDAFYDLHVSIENILDAPGGYFSLQRVTVRDNLAIKGGGVAIAGDSFIGTSRIANNTSIRQGGGVLVDPGGRTYILDSTIDGNVARGQFGSAVRGEGRTIIDNTTISNHRESAGVTTVEVLEFTAITRSTISGNTDNRLIEVLPSGTLELFNSTIVDNTTTDAVSISGGSVVVGNSLIAGNNGSDITLQLGGHLGSNGFNLLGTVRDGPGIAPGTVSSRLHPNDIIQADATLFVGPLEDNGGPTLTHRLLKGSRAIDAGSVNGGLVNESEPNDFISEAQSLETAPWLQQSDFQAVVPLNQQRPHVTIRGRGDATFDYYRFTNPVDNNEFIFDIDVDRGGGSNLDSSLFLYDGAGNLIAENGDSFFVDAGSTSPLDSFLTVPDLAAGDYIIAVGTFDSVGLPGEVVGTPPQFGDDYTLHVVAEVHPSVFGFGRDQAGTFMPQDGDGNRVAVSDIGSLEKVFGSVEGVLYFDLDGDRARDLNEVGIEGQTVFLDRNRNGVFDSGERFTKTVGDDPATADFVETGRYKFDRIEPGEVAIGQVLQSQYIATEMGFGAIERISLQANGDESSFGSFGPSLSGDGRFVAYGQFLEADGSRVQYMVHDRQRNEIEVLPLPMDETGVGDGISQAADGSVLIVGEAPSISDDGDRIAFVAREITPTGSSVTDVYIYDRKTKELDKISKPLLGSEANGDSRDPQISADGRFIVFESDASDLIAVDGNSTTDVFLYSVETGIIGRVSQSEFGVEGNGPSYRPTVSGDGGFVAFASMASNLATTPDTNGFEDVFVINTDSGEVQIVTTALDGSASNCSAQPGGEPCDLAFPDISDDGQFIVFRSLATNLLAAGEVEPGSSSAYIFDRVNDVMERVNNTTSGGPTGGVSRAPSVSADGRYVVYESTGSIIPGVLGNFGVTLTYLADRVEGTVDLISQSLDNVLGNSTREALAATAISADGNHVAFESFSGNLVDNDFNGTKDIFVRSTKNLSTLPFATLNLFAGEEVRGLNFGTAPVDGRISGRVFEDLSQQGAAAFGPGLVNVPVFLDLNGNRGFDFGEPLAFSDFDGNYVLTSVPSAREYAIGAIAPEGFAQVIPSFARGGVLEIFLPAGGVVGNRDFGFVRADTGGQFSNSSIEGRVYADNNEDKVQQPGEPGIAGTTVFLDFNDNQLRDFNEPQVTTRADDPATTSIDEAGLYKFTGLGSRPYVIRTINSNQIIQTTPRGSRFDSSTFMLRDDTGKFTNVQDIVTADMNGDSFPDLIVALFGGNEVSIRLNQGDGTFSQDAFNFSVAPNGIGPIALAVADLNGVGSLDLIVANNLSSTATILLDFDPVQSKFASITTINVGETPLDIATGDFDGVNGIDFAVTNESQDQVTVMLNDGSGTFSRFGSVLTGGVSPTSLVAGDFNSDLTLDLAVTNFGLGAAGSVAILLGEGTGAFTLHASYPVGNGPVSITTGTFNDDNFDDLAVANFSSNTASVLAGSASGTFTVRPQQLAVGQGPIQIETTDIEGDGDADIVVTNLNPLSSQVSILRGSPDRGSLAFEPVESFGVAEAAVSKKVAFAIADINKDGTQDIVVAKNSDDTVNVLLNRRVDGAHRVLLDGVQQVVGFDFGTKPALILPSMDPIADPSPVVEDALAQSILLTGIAKGRQNGPPLQFSTSSSKTSLISTPTIAFVDGSNTATLSYTVVGDASGSSEISVTVIDAGADQVPGTTDDATLTRTFTVTVLPVNDPPVFTIPASLNVLEDSGGQTHIAFVAGKGVGGGISETGQTLSDFVVNVADPSFFAALPSINADGDLQFTPALDVSGTVMVSVSLSDDGGTANGGSNTTSAAFVINLAPVNDAPSVTIGSDQAAFENSGAQSVAGFASNFAPGGGADEATQVISDFVVTNDNNSLFAVQPKIASDGSLTYTPASIADGEARVTVSVRDSGGTTNGGVDLSVPQTFLITVSPVPDTIAPTPVISSDQPALTNQNTFDVTVDFGEPVVDFDSGDVTAPGATVGAATDQGNGRFLLSITMPTNGLVSIGVAAGVATDVAGNANVAATPLELTIDSDALVPVVTTSEANPTSSGTFEVSIDFGETVTGFSAIDLALTGATASNLIDQQNGKFVVTITATADGQVSVIVPARAATDLAGNDSVPSAPLVITVDTSPPSPILRSFAPAVVNEPVLNVEADFGELVSGVAGDDFVISSGAIELLSHLGSGRFLVRVGGIADGPFTISLAAGAAQDIAGNQSLAADDLTRTIAASSRDFGDAPTVTQSGFAASYPTLAADGGASHVLGGLFLGGTASSEADGKPTASANGDSDDGVAFVLTAVADAASATISSVIVESSGPGMLDAWIDFNRDGTWDSGEQIFASVSVTAGENLLPYTIPAGALPGVTFARFRVSSAGGLAPDGPADDGEVEDYRVTLANANALPEIKASAEILDSLRVVVNASQVQVVSGNTVVGQSRKVAVGGVTIVDQGDATIVRIATSTAIVGTISVDPAGLKSVLALQGSQLLDLTLLLNGALQGIQQIDLSGGDHQLILNAVQVANVAKGSDLELLFQKDDEITLGSGWQLDGVERDSNSHLIRRILQNGTVVKLDGEDAYTNPLIRFDVNGIGGVTSSDALAIINELRARRFSDSPQGTFRDPAEVDLSAVRFYDVTRDLLITSLDALRVINELARQNSGGAGEQGEFVNPAIAVVEKKRNSSTVETLSPSVSVLVPQPKSLLASTAPLELVSLVTTADMPEESPADDEATPLSAQAIDEVIRTQW